MQTYSQTYTPKKGTIGTAVVVVGVLVLGAVLVVSLVRDRIVNPVVNQVTVTGRGIVPYQPDIAVVTLGAQVDKATTSEDAFNQLNGRVAKIIAALDAIGVPKENVQTQSYTVTPQYDFRDNVSVLAGYNANQQLSVKITGIGEGTQQLSKVIAEASKAGANQVLGITFDASSVSELKQKARLAAISDARGKAPELAKSAGVKFGKIVGWYESVLQEPGQMQQAIGYGAGSGGAGGAGSMSPQIPSGTQEVIIEVGINYVVK